MPKGCRVLRFKHCASQGQALATGWDLQLTGRLVGPVGSGKHVRSTLITTHAVGYTQGFLSRISVSCWTMKETTYSDMSEIYWRYPKFSPSTFSIFPHDKISSNK